MPFGLKNTAQTFQRLMDNVTSQLRGVFVYIDDVLVTSASAAQHERDLWQLFSTLQRFGLALNINKCVFGTCEFEFLGHHVSTQDIRPLLEKVEAVKCFECPRTLKSRMVNFYRRFLPNIAATMRPLTDALLGTPCQLTWNDAMTSAFIRTKQRLAEATLLFHPTSDADLRINTDASELQGHCGCNPPGRQRSSSATGILQSMNNVCRIPLLGLRFGTPHDLLHDPQVSAHARRTVLPNLHGSETADERFLQGPQPRQIGKDTSLLSSARSRRTSPTSPVSRT